MEERATLLDLFSFVAASHSFLLKIAKYRDIIVNDVVGLMNNPELFSIKHFLTELYGLSQSFLGTEILNIHLYWSFLACWPPQIRSDIKRKSFNKLCNTISHNQKVF